MNFANMGKGITLNPFDLLKARVQVNLQMSGETGITPIRSLSKKTEEVICRGKELQENGRKDWHGVAMTNEIRAIIARIRLWGKGHTATCLEAMKTVWNNGPKRIYRKDLTRLYNVV